MADAATVTPDPTPKPFDPQTIEAMRETDYCKLMLLAPYDDTTGAFLALLKSARESILISIYGFTLTEAVDVLIAKHQAGISVRMLFDHTQEQGPAELAQVRRLEAAGVPHWIGTSPDAHQILHSKVTVVDGVLCETGSWNYSYGASKQSNTWLLERDPAGAAKLTAFIERIIAWVEANEATLQMAAPTPPAVPAQGAT